MQIDESVVNGLVLLADKVGQSTETLIEYFAVRAPYIFAAPVIAWCIAAVAFTLSAFIFNRIGEVVKATAAYIKRGESEAIAELRATGDIDGHFLAAVIAGIVGVLSVFIGFLSLYSAILAVASPEAYALETIFNMIKD